MEEKKTFFVQCNKHLLEQIQHRVKQKGLGKNNPRYISIEEEWLNENVTGEYSLIDKRLYGFEFEDEADAMAFKLRWSE